MKWQNDNKLSVYHGYDTGIIKREISKDGIDIEYFDASKFEK